MKTTTTNQARILGIALLASAWSAQAAGPLDLCGPNVPFLWPNGGTNIPFNPDQGDLGILDAADAVARVEEAFQAWEDVPTSTVSYANAGLLPVDVDETNFFDFFFTRCRDDLSPIVFDDDGAIFEFLFGPDSGVLGFAGPDVEDPATCQITEGAAFLNGPVFDTVRACWTSWCTSSATTRISRMPWSTGRSSSATRPARRPTTTPLAHRHSRTGWKSSRRCIRSCSGGVDQLTRTPDPDDRASISNAVSDGGFPGDDRDDPRHDSRARQRNQRRQRHREERRQPVRGRGLGHLRRLHPGCAADRRIHDQRLDARRDICGLHDVILAGGFSTPPRFALPGPEEFHSTNESDTDDLLQFDGVTVAAGSPRTGIDVIFNRFLAGTPLPVADDFAVEIFLPFEFRMCGDKFESVFINANGNVTFGNPDFGFIENVPAFLGGPPRIAGLWRDLSPFNLFTNVPQGSVTFSETKNRFTVHWNGVPEFPNEGSNTFSITLNRLLDIVEIKTGSMTAANGLVGISCGGAFTSQFEQESNLRRFLTSRPCGHRTACLPVDRPAIYELFDADDHDLDNTRLFGTTLSFSDRFEPNNSRANAKTVALPFNTTSESRFTEIRPAGGDVDYFRARNLKQGQTLIADLVSGQFDSVLGIFDSAGNLLVVDDDSGVGFLSRIEFEIPADGTYFIAVSTFADFDFTGDGNTDPIFGIGRYVIDVQTF